MLLVVGHVGKAHGLRGEVLVHVRSDEPEERFVPGAVFVTASGKLTLESLRWHQGRVIAQFEGVHDRDVLRIRYDSDPRPREHRTTYGRD